MPTIRAGGAFRLLLWPSAMRREPRAGPEMSRPSATSRGTPTWARAEPCAEAAQRRTSIFAFMPRGDAFSRLRPTGVEGAELLGGAAAGLAGGSRSALARTASWRAAARLAPGEAARRLTEGCGPATRCARPRSWCRAMPAGSAGSRVRPCAPHGCWRSWSQQRRGLVYGRPWETPVFAARATDGEGHHECTPRRATSDPREAGSQASRCTGILRTRRRGSRVRVGGGRRPSNRPAPVRFFEGSWRAARDGRHGPLRRPVPGVTAETGANRGQRRGAGTGSRCEHREGE